jgi:hypothetical protein
MIFDKISISLIFVILLAVSSHIFITHISRKYTKKLVITTLLLQKIDKRVALGERGYTPLGYPETILPSQDSMQIPPLHKEILDMVHYKIKDQG